MRGLKEAPLHLASQLEVLRGSNLHEALGMKGRPMSSRCRAPLLVVVAVTAAAGDVGTVATLGLRCGGAIVVPGGGTEVRRSVYGKVQLRW